MNIVDRKRIAAVAALEALGFTFDGERWQPPFVTYDPEAEEEAQRRLDAAAEAYERELAQGIKWNVVE